MEQQNQDPILMPGPQFDGENNETGWLQKNSQNLIIGVIIILLGIGIFSFYKNYRDRQQIIDSAINSSESPAASEQVAGPGAQADAKNKISIVTPETQKSEAIVNEIPQSPQIINRDEPTIKVSGQAIAVKASKGEGATHLARRALKEYIKDKGLKDALKAEQKIYNGNRAGNQLFAGFNGRSGSECPKSIRCPIAKLAKICSFSSFFVRDMIKPAETTQIFIYHILSKKPALLAGFLLSTFYLTMQSSRIIINSSSFCWLMGEDFSPQQKQGKREKQ